MIFTKLRTFAIKTCLAGRFDESSTFVLTSSPRSGSTVLGNALSVIPHSCLLFEPLHLRNVPEAAASNLSWRTYVDPECEWPEGEMFFRKVFEGKVINGWTSKEMSLREAFLARKLIVKFVRANRLLPWICQTFEIPSPILLIRHPCAVIASQLRSGWKNVQRSEAPPFLDRYPLFRSVLSKTEGDEENLAAVWALDQLPPLLQKNPHPWTIVTFEELVLRPEQTLEKIFRKWNLHVDIEAAISRLRTPSSTVSRWGISGISGWKEQLTAEQVSGILRTVHGLGLEFYTRNDEANYKALHGGQLAEQIQSAGIGYHNHT